MIQQISKVKRAKKNTTKTIGNRWGKGFFVPGDINSVIEQPVYPNIRVDNEYDSSIEKRFKSQIDCMQELQKGSTSTTNETADSRLKKINDIRSNVIRFNDREDLSNRQKEREEKKAQTCQTTNYARGQ